jgi:WD40 repeat protein
MNLWRVTIEEESGKVLGAPEPVTTPSPFSGYISFSADGRRLAYVHQVRTVNVERIAFDPVTEAAVGRPVAITQGLKVLRGAVPSSDGRWVALSSGGPREDIFLMQAAGPGMRQLTDDPHSDRMPVWSPDDKRIAFCSNRTGKSEIWIINADGSGLRQLTEVPGAHVVGPVWSPDGTRLACSPLGGDPLIISANSAWNEQRPEAVPPLRKRNVFFAVRSWSPDGTKLAGDLRRAESSSSGLAVYSLAQKEHQQLTELGAYPRWLSDSRRLVFYDESRMHLIDSRSGRVREIYSIAPHTIEHGPSFNISGDDRWIYFSREINEADIWLMDARR